MPYQALFARNPGSYGYFPARPVPGLDPHIPHITLEMP